MIKKSKEDIHYKKKKANKKTKPNNVSARNKNNELFDFDKEIVIGMPRISDDKEKNKKNKKTSVNTNKNKQNAKKKLTKQQQIAIKKKKAILKIVKVLTLIIVIIGVSIYVALSPLFNIKEINVTGNSKLSKEEIISLSELKTDENTFKVSKKNTKNKVKANAYIENVKIRRKLPDKVEIIVVERVATYMIPFANSYIYINNQGYMLEITSQKAEMPAIVGISTPEEELHEGQRLISEDLVKLGEVLQIMESANANELVDLITKIDISNRQDYILTLEKEKKAIHLGDVSNLSTKMAYVKKILNDELPLIDAKSIFEMNTPEYSANLIKELF